MKIVFLMLWLVSVCVGQQEQPSAADSNSTLPAITSLVLGSGDGEQQFTIKTPRTSVTSVLNTISASIAAVYLGAVTLTQQAGRKREICTNLPVRNPEVYFTMAQDSDFLGCSQRFVCEVVAADTKHELSQEEKIIKSTFRAQLSAPVGSAKALYIKAAGRVIQEGPEACAQHFSTCPFDRKPILKHLQWSYQDVLL